MSETDVGYITYSKRHEDIVKEGINSIEEFFNSADVKEKRSLLFCLDKYLDPYYGFNLPHFSDIILLLQKQLFIKNDKEVKEDIFQLLSEYSEDSLDYLAEKIDQIEPSFLADAIYTLGMTFNKKYLDVIKRFEYHYDLKVQNTAKQVLREFFNSNSLKDE